MTKTVKMQVNEKQLIATMKDAFTNDHAVITELAQNAKRAGATEILFTTHNLSEAGKEAKPEFSLEISDNGTGIDDLQTLFSVASSGWGDKTIEEENPFGMGFLIAIYSAKKITVWSKGKTLSSTKEDLLSLKDIPVRDCAVAPGTTILLEGISLDNCENQYRFNSLVKHVLTGFSLPVLTKMTESDALFLSIEREHSAENLKDSGEYTEFKNKYGTVYIRNTTVHFTLRTPRYFQGLEVGAPGNYYYNFTSYPSMVTHLTKEVGRIRIPDRDVFIDTAKANSVIRDLEKEAITSFILGKKDDFLFMNNIHRQLRTYDLQYLLNDMDTIPYSLVETFSGLNVDNQENNYEGKDCEWLNTQYSHGTKKEDLEDVVVVVIDDETPEQFSVYDSSLAAFTVPFLLEYLASKGEIKYVVVDKSNFHASHWILKNAVNFNDVLASVEVTVNKPREAVVASGNSFYSEVVIQLCESFSIEATIANTKYNTGAVSDNYCITKEGALIGDTAMCYDIMTHVACYQGESHYDEGYEHTQQVAFDKWLVKERCSSNPEKLLRTYLGEADLSPLQGKTFHIEFNKNEFTINMQP